MGTANSFFPGFYMRNLLFLVFLWQFFCFCGVVLSGEAEMRLLQSLKNESWVSSGGGTGGVGPTLEHGGRATMRAPFCWKAPGLG